jgi:hypothetical protein
MVGGFLVDDDGVSRFKVREKKREERRGGRGKSKGEKRRPEGAGLDFWVQEQGFRIGDLLLSGTPNL